jgi:hypothetical protein
MLILDINLKKIVILIIVSKFHGLIVLTPVTDCDQMHVYNFSLPASFSFPLINLPKFAVLIDENLELNLCYFLSDSKKWKDRKWLKSKLLLPSTGINIAHLDHKKSILAISFGMSEGCLF